MLNRILFSLLFFFPVFKADSQALSYTDPAAGYLKIILEKGSEGTYQQVGNFKVIGTSYLYGERLNGSAFAKNEKSENVGLSYNLYKQQLDVYPNQSNFAIIKPADEIDSFVMYKSASQYIKEDLSFYTSRLFDNNLPDCFLLMVQNGERFKLFKSYKATLDFVSTNYIQSELRQFSIDYTYYYYDVKSRGLKKIKLTKKKIAEEFASIMDVSEILDHQSISTNPEQTLKAIFEQLNKK